jgi:hypothetical protein
MAASPRLRLYLDHSWGPEAAADLWLYQFSSPQAEAKSLLSPLSCVSGSCHQIFYSDPSVAGQSQVAICQHARAEE